MDPLGNVLITGGTGFIGRALIRDLMDRGHRIYVTSRRPETVAERCGEEVVGISDLKGLSAPLEAVINLAGASIAGGRWTQSRKRALRDSRLRATGSVMDYLRNADAKPRTLISASAVGVYGNRGDELLDERSAPGDDFLARLCLDWETAALEAEALGVATTILRIGLVAGTGGGILSRLKMPYRFGLGGRLGSGRQWMSWIALDDLVALVGFLLDHPLAGPVNATAPEPVRQVDFARALASALHRPAPWRIPSGALSLLLGELAITLLASQRVVPRRLEAAGFAFASPTLEAALRVAW